MVTKKQVATKSNGRTTPSKPRKSVTSAAQWKRGQHETDLEVPSGNVCRVKRPEGMQAFLANGIIPNALMPMVQEALDNGEAKPEDLTEVLKDPAKLQALFELVDHVICHTVVLPVVLPVPAEGTARDEDALYVDEIEMDDKMFIFTYATAGAKDLESFRKGQATNVAAVLAESGVPHKSE